MTRRLEVRDLVVNYGEVPGVKGISLHVDQGEIVALLGANGAGKSTTLKALMGMVRSTSGSILLDGKDVSGEPAYTAPRRKEQLAGTLSGGEQQMLAIGRALMAKPDFILLDEPSLGLAPLVVADVMNVVRRISCDFGIGAILVEQNVGVALDVASRAYVLCRGEIALADQASAVRTDPALRRAYLGMGH
jgi:branched-chain amino acid transport system ATP-binding protein